MDQWNQIKDPEVNPHPYRHLIFDQEAKIIQWGKKESIFSEWCWSNWMSAWRRMQINPYLSPSTKCKFKWIKDLNVNPDTLNLIQEKVGNNLRCIGTGDSFLNSTTNSTGTNSFHLFLVMIIHLIPTLQHLSNRDCVPCDYDFKNVNCNL